MIILNKNPLCLDNSPLYLWNCQSSFFRNFALSGKPLIITEKRLHNLIFRCGINYGSQVVIRNWRTFDHVDAFNFMCKTSCHSNALTVIIIKPWAIGVLQMKSGQCISKRHSRTPHKSQRNALLRSTGSMQITRNLFAQFTGTMLLT